MNMNIRVRGGREEGDVYHTHIHALLTSKKPRGRTHIRMERRGKRIKRWQIRDKSIARTRGFNTSLINLSLTNERTVWEGRRPKTKFFGPAREY